MKLFLDDERFPPQDGDEWVIVRTADEARAYCVRHGCPEFISFDHDLGPDADNTGHAFAKWLVEQDLDAPGFIPQAFAFYVHSQNPNGRDNIQGYLDGYLRFRSS